MGNNSLVGIDIFCGAGGLSLGAQLAGITLRGAIEKDLWASCTYRRNHPEVNVICDDIHNVDPTVFKINPSEDLIVFGGPPCQGFSLSNTRTRNLKNPNNSLFEEFVRFVSILKPRWFVFENVEGFVRFGNGLVRNTVKQCFENLGYTVIDKVLNASDFGVPQNRHRYFLIGNNSGIAFEFPHSVGIKYSVENAISDLPDLNNGQMIDKLEYKLSYNESSRYAQEMRYNSSYSLQNYVSRNSDLVLRRYSHIKQGENWSAIPKYLMSNYANTHNCHSGIYKRLVASRPSVVISNYRKNMLIHPWQDRGLSVREAARLQSFPDHYLFEGSLMHIQQQIGNAVPPMLAKSVFDQILKCELNVKDML